MLTFSNDLAAYVSIDSRYCLRGWLDQPYAVLDKLTATAHFIPKGLFDTLQLCNGRFRPSDAIFFGARQMQLDQLAREGVLTFTDEPCSLAPDQEYRYYPNHYMRQIQWSLTGRCNYRCRHCFMGAPHGVLPQPSTEECLSIADQMGECGIQVVKLTGGEPLVRSDFLQIVDRLLENGVQISTILTNGALVSEKLLGALEGRNVRCGFDISFDGTDGWHDWLRGVEGAEDAAVRAFALCREHGFPTGAQVMLHRDSASSLRDTVRLLGELGVSSVVAGSIDDEGDARGIADLLLSYDELFDLCCEYLPQFLEDGAPVPQIALGGIFKVLNGVPGLAQGRVSYGDGCAERPACATVRSTMYIGSDGYILPCVSMSYEDALKQSFPAYDKMSLRQALTSSSYYDMVAATVGDVFDRNPTCRACAYKDRCLGGCRAKATDETGRPDPMGVDLNACRFYLGGYYDRAKRVVADLGFGGRGL